MPFFFQFAFVVDSDFGDQRQYFFVASSEDEREGWIESIHKWRYSLLVIFYTLYFIYYIDSVNCKLIDISLLFHQNSPHIYIQ